MKPLEQTYRKNSYDYELVERNEYAAIYRQTKEGRTVAFEVGRIKSDNGGTFAGVTIQPGERFWSNEDFGVIAWVKQTEEEARRAFTALTMEALTKTPA